MSSELSVSTLKRLDRICNKFEDAIVAEQTPLIETLLVSETEPARSRLLKDLLLVEFAFRQLPPSSPDLNEYLDRFPDDEGTLSAAWSEYTAAEAGQQPAEPAATLCEGDEVGGYVIQRLLGRGAYGEVCLARDDQRARLVALKILRPQACTPASVLTFLNEAANLSRLSCAGVAKVYEYANPAKGVPFVALEYVKGDSLREILDAGQLSFDRCLRLLAQVCETIHEIHLRGVYHRDLKPSNVIAGLDGLPRVVDFGLALHESEQHMRAGEYAGTTPYMSPEQIRGAAHHLDGRSDVWAVGVMLYEALAERRPFEGDSRAELADAILNRDPRPLRQIDDAIPRELEQVCLKALSKDIDSRYLTAADMANDLWRVLDEMPPALRDTSPTWRQRAEVAVAEHARYWSENPQRRRLPGVLRYWQLRLLTDRQNWTPLEANMMRAAARKAAVRVVTAFMLGAVSLFTAVVIRDNYAQQHRTEVVAQLGDADSQRVDGLLRELHNAGNSVEAGLRDALQRAEQQGAWQAVVRYRVALIPFDEQQRDRLCEAVLNAQSDQVSALRETVLQRDVLNEQRMVQRLWSELERAPVTIAGIHQLWPRPDGDAVELLQRNHGDVAEHFAYCPALTMREFIDVSNHLASARYRPQRAHTYRDGPSLMVAAVWVRDNGEWKFDTELRLQTLALSAAQRRQEGYQPVHISGHVTTDGTGEDAARYAVVWVRRDESDHSDWPHLLAGVVPETQWKLAKTSGDKVHVPRSYSTFAVSPGHRLSCAIWGGEREVEQTAAQYVFDEVHPDYFEDLPGLADVSLDTVDGVGLNEQRYSLQLALAQDVLASQPRNLAATFLAGRAHHYLGQDQLALACLNQVVDESPQYRAFAMPLRAIVHARLGQCDESQRDLRSYREYLLRAGAKGDWREAYLTTLQTKADLCCADAHQAVAAVDEFVAANSESRVSLFYAACAYSAAGQWTQASDANASRRCIERALACAREALERGLQPARLLTTADLEAMRGDTGFADVAAPRKLVSYSAFWRPDDSESRFTGGGSLAKHAAACREFRELGLLPTSISAVQVDGATTVASVWRGRAETERESLRRANAAATLLQISGNERLYMLLRGDKRPTLRSWLIDRIPRFGVDPQLLIERFQTETEDSVRQALLLALGGYSADRLPETLVEAFTPHLQSVYANDRSAAVHAAAGWLLRRWNRDHLIANIEQTLRRSDVPSDKADGWYVDQAGHTMVVLRATDQLAIGSPSFETGHGPTEARTLARIPYAFAISDCEVTVAQMRRFLPDFAPDHPGHLPAQDVSWFQAAAYCDWLCEQAGISPGQRYYLANSDGEFADGMKIAPHRWRLSGYRLPTELEWEFACRAGTRTGWSYGESLELLDTHAWHFDNAERRLHAGGLKHPNLFGLFDMHGNVPEWCYAWTDKPLADLPRSTAVSVAHSDQMTQRGGAFNLGWIHSRSAARLPKPARSQKGGGFRIVRTLQSLP